MALLLLLLLLLVHLSELHVPHYHSLSPQPWLLLLLVRVT
jgi:hypothetical protein